jgi:hypothetical protein
MEYEFKMFRSPLDPVWEATNAEIISNLSFLIKIGVIYFLKLDMHVSVENSKISAEMTICVMNTYAPVRGKFQRWPSLSKTKVKVKMSKFKVPILRSSHKEHAYEIQKPYHLQFKRCYQF